jgi:hypothetical protein
MKSIINILRATSRPVFLRQNLQYVTGEKARKALLYEKFARKMLMKLTHGNEWSV